MTKDERVGMLVGGVVLAILRVTCFGLGIAAAIKYLWG